MRRSDWFQVIGVAAHGRECRQFMHASIWHNSVCNSLKVKDIPLTTLVRWNLTLFTALYHTPPKCGDAGGLNLQVIPSDARQPSTLLTYTASSLRALTKFVPLSLQTMFGLPLLDMNLLNAAKNALVVKSSTASMWTALVENQTNISIHAFLPGLPRIPLLMISGPAKSTPVVVNGREC